MENSNVTVVMDDEQKVIVKFRKFLDHSGWPSFLYDTDFVKNINALVIDVRSVDQIDIKGETVLMMLRTYAKGRNIEMYICCSSHNQHVAQAVESAGIDQLFEMDGDVEEHLEKMTKLELTDLVDKRFLEFGAKSSYQRPVFLSM